MQREWSSKSAFRIALGGAYIVVIAVTAYIVMTAPSTPMAVGATFTALIAMVGLYLIAFAVNDTVVALMTMNHAQFKQLEAQINKIGAPAAATATKECPICTRPLSNGIGIFKMRKEERIVICCRTCHPVYVRNGWTVSTESKG